MFPRIRVVVTPIAAAAALACSGDGSPTEAAAPGTTPLPVQISGTVRDSLTGRGVAEALVTTATGRALADEAGRFTVVAPRGRTRIHVAHPQYSLKSFERVAAPEAGFPLDVAPLAPTVLGCEVRQGVMWMLVADLQGRKTIVRRDSSGVTLGGGDAPRWIVAHDFTWWAIDELTWLVDGPAASPDDVATARWRLFDTDGNVRPHGCGGDPVPVRGDDGGDGGGGSGGGADTTIAARAG
jgi:hypothetical protein